MNEHFVAIKVDREERPDVDAIYMEAVQGMTGHGGWPLTAFCDPDGVPFHCGTYFPPEPASGDAELSDGDGGRRRRLARAARGESVPPPGRTRTSSARSARIARRSERRALTPRTSPKLAVDGLSPIGIDPVNGGFGALPKFPPASALDLLFAHGLAESRSS